MSTNDLDAHLASLDKPAEKPLSKRDPKYIERAAAGIVRTLNLPALYTIPGLLGDVAGVDTKLPGHEGAATAANSINKGINEFYGIDDPQTPDEWAAELSSALLPTGAASLAAKAPAALKPAGHIADALLMPGVQGKYTAVKAGTNIGVPFTAIQGLNEIAEDEQGDTETVFDYATGEETTDDLSKHLRGFDAPLSDPDEEFAKLDLDLDAKAEAEDDYMKKAAVAGLTLAGGVALARRRKARTLEDLEKRATEPSLFEPHTEGIASTGDLVKGNVFDEMEPLAKTIERTADKETAEIFRAQARLGNQVGTTSKHEAAFTTGNYPLVPGADKATPIKSRPMQDIMYAMDQLDDAAKTGVDESLAILDELDQMRLTHGKALAADTKSGYQGIGKRELEVRLAKHMEDPRVQAVVKEMQQQPRTMLDYAQQGQLLSAAKVRDLKQAHPNFMPRDDYEIPRLRDIFFGKKTDLADAIDEAMSPFERKRSTDKAVGEAFKYNFMPPTQRLIEMQRRLIKAVEVNNMRRTFFDSILNDEGYSRVKGIYKVPSERMSRMNKSEIVKVRRAGDDEFWRVKDSTLRGILQRGGQGIPLSSFFSAMNKLRQVRQFMTTGFVTNPAFQAIAGQVWEPIWAMVNTPKGFTTGGVKSPLIGIAGMVKGMKAAHAQRLGEFYRQEFLLRELGIEKAQSPLGKLWSHLVSDTKNLTDQQLEALAQTYSDAYARSSVHLYRVMGGGGTQAFQDLALGTGNKLNVVDAPAVRKLKQSVRQAVDSDYTPDLNIDNLSHRRSTMGHYARAMLDAIHNGTRYQLFDMNVPKAVKEGAPVEDYIDDLARVAFKTRDLMDMSAHGYGKVTQGMNATVPYFNAMLQGFYRAGKQWKEQPLRTTAAFSAIASASALNTWLISRDERFRDWYWNELTPEKRAGMIIPVSDDPRDSIIIPLDPIVATQWQIGQNFFDASFGISSGMIDPNVARSLDKYFMVEDEQGMTPFERRQGDMTASMKRLGGIATPPAAQVAAGMMGKRMKDLSLTEFAGQDVQPYNPMSDVPTKYVKGVIDNQVETIMAGLFGEMATGTMVDFIEALHMKSNQPGTKVWERLGYGWDQLKSSYGGRLAGADAAVSSYNTEARELREYGQSAKRMEQRFEEVRRGGFTRSSGGARLMGQTGAFPPQHADPVQSAMFDYVVPRYQGVKRMFESQPNGLSDLMKQRSDILSDPRRSADQKRKDMNAVSKQIQVIQSEYLRAIEILEDDTAKRFGMESFDIREWEGQDFTAPQLPPPPGATAP